MLPAENIPNVILSSGNKIPMIGMGTAYQVVDYDQVYVKQAILEAIEQGYRHFDTSPNYMSESLIGEAIAESLSRGVIHSRHEIFVTSKLWLTDAHSDLVVPALRSHPIKPEDLLPMDFESVWRAMEDCQRLGLTKSIGVSNFTCKKLKYLLTFARIPPCVNQVEMNPVWQQKQLRDFCSSNGILVIAYAPLGAKGAHWGTNQVMDCKLLKEIALTRGKTIAQVCLRWVYEQGAGMVVKSFNKERMKENLSIFDWELSDEDYLKINKIQQQRGMPKSRFVSENGPYKSLEELWDGEI
ncbi:non-functional NADPH-dependent codeinone reductase 2 [Artemisia annua]|uniref:Non-functional NADPH-dependent codeinone reductase 2 n=1 Tax=Artemisia annua TaxID=35608 RepID=A0A2U1KNE8_ARTAN|nr:non-functional NADPH-dependent codeinone reductase 2 [Artemisia annua]